MSAGRAAWSGLAKGVVDASASPSRLDGLSVAPLSEPRRDDPVPSALRAGNWRVLQRVDHPDPASASRQVRLDLEGGADALTLAVAGSPFARGFGLDPERLVEALDGVELDLIWTRLDAGAATLAATRVLAEHIAERRWTSAGLVLDLCYDPLALAARGQAQPDDDLPRLLDLQARAGLAGRPLLADGRPWHEAGADPALELACCLAAGVGLLRRLEALGHALDAGRALIALLLAADADLYVGIAKARAARRLWARLEAASGLEPRPMRLHAETSWRMLGRFDPWANMMRTVSGLVAAGLGGVDGVTALPFTLANGLPDEAARRLARTAQRVALDEAHFGAVEDPAAGSGALEEMTDALCRQAWSTFQEIEREGGLLDALDHGTLRSRLAEAAARRASAFADQQASLVGTSRFPRLAPDAIATLDVPRREARRAAETALPARRDAEPFESRRDRVEALPVRPSVALIAHGGPAAYGVRARLAANLLAVAGIGVSGPPDAGGTASSPSAAVVCLVGDDAAYAADGGRTVARLRETGASFVIVCGPQEAKATTGADLALDDRCDLPAALDAVLVAFEVP